MIRLKLSNANIMCCCCGCFLCLTLLYFSKRFHLKPRTLISPVAEAAVNGV